MQDISAYQVIFAPVHSSISAHSTCRWLKLDYSVLSVIPFGMGGRLAQILYPSLATVSTLQLRHFGMQAPSSEEIDVNVSWKPILTNADWLCLFNLCNLREFFIRNAELLLMMPSVSPVPRSLQGEFQIAHIKVYSLTLCDFWCSLQPYTMAVVQWTL